MRTHAVLALALGALALAPGAFAQGEPEPAVGKAPFAAEVSTLFESGQMIAAAAALHKLDYGRWPSSVRELADGGFVIPEALRTSGIARQGATWRIALEDGAYAEIPLATSQPEGPECREAARQARIGGSDPSFGCHATDRGVVFRFGL